MFGINGDKERLNLVCLLAKGVHHIGDLGECHGAGLWALGEAEEHEQKTTLEVVLADEAAERVPEQELRIMRGPKDGRFANRAPETQPPNSEPGRSHETSRRPKNLWCSHRCLALCRVRDDQSPSFT